MFPTVWMRGKFAVNFLVVLLIFIVCWTFLSRRSTIETYNHKIVKLHEQIEQAAKTVNAIQFEKSDLPTSNKLRPNSNLQYIEYIRRDCDQLCNTSRPGTPGPYFDHIKTPINCDAIFRNEYVDIGHGLPHAPKEIPTELLNDYTMNGRVPIKKWYFDEQYLGKKAFTPKWTKERVEQNIKEATTGKLFSPYGIAEINALRDGLKHAPGIENGRVLVIGSERPWAEACVLEAGAREVVTLEYGKIISEHPKIKTIVPYDFRMQYLNNTLGQFDAIVTFSSVEHSGLGRYGDALNPWGDIIAIARAWCVTKTGGSLTLGVEYKYDGEYIAFNAHRYYGKIRYPYLTTNWNQHYRGIGKQLVHVFIK